MKKLKLEQIYLSAETVSDKFNRSLFYAGISFKKAYWNNEFLLLSGSERIGYFDIYSYELRFYFNLKGLPIVFRIYNLMRHNFNEEN